MVKEAKKTNGSETHSRGVKGSGPIVITYLTSDGEDKRVNDKTQGIRVADKNGNHVDFDVASLPAQTLQQLAILGIVKRVDTFVRNGAKLDGANVIELTNKVIGSLKEGTLYARGENKGTGTAGRPFNIKFYRGIMEAMSKAKGKLATEAQLDNWETKTLSRTPADRKIYLKGLEKDPIYLAAKKSAELAELKGQIKSGKKEAETDAMADLF